jgi:chromosome segregation ATPase
LIDATRDALVERRANLEPALAEVATTLDAAALDDTTASVLMAGRLERAATASSAFDVLTPNPALRRQGVRARKRAASTSNGLSTRNDDARILEAGARLDEAARAVADAQSRLDAAETTLRQATAELEQARRARDRAQSALERAQRARERAQTAYDRI